MTWIEFIIRLMLAQLLGAVIGVERQWRQRMAGLRTNALVATGAALFVMLGSMIPGESSPTRVVPYVVSGIGFVRARIEKAWSRLTVADELKLNVYYRLTPTRYYPVLSDRP
jgi:MgtC family